MTAAVLAVTALASGAYSAYEQNQQAKAQQKMYDLQAEEQMKQAALEVERAGMEQENAERDARMRYQQLQQDIGATYAAAAGNGVLLDSGSVSSVINANRGEAAADIDTLLSKKNLEIWGHTQNAGAYARQSGISKFQGRQARAAGKSAMIGAGIGTFGSTVSAFGSGMQIGDKINTRYKTQIW
jgi:hypothetical protein